MPHLCRKETRNTNAKKPPLCLSLRVSSLWFSRRAQAPPPDDAVVGETSESPDTADVIGAVRFETSCDDASQPAFESAVATLHSFEFDEARGMFEAIGSNNPDYAMAEWGVAMTYYHPLWAPPTAQELAGGAAAVAKARTLDADERERLYIEAIGALFDDAETAPHRGPGGPPRGGDGPPLMAYPDDTEAEIFYALAVLSNADPTDKSYAVQKRTGALLEPLSSPCRTIPVWRTTSFTAMTIPISQTARWARPTATSRSPLRCLTHYTCRGTSTHSSGCGMNRLVRTFDPPTQRESAPALFGLGEGTQGELHALDYLVYAHLQQGDDDKAEAIVDHVNSIQISTWVPGSWFSMRGAVPVRYAIERHDWQAAAALQPLGEVDAAGGNDQSMNAVALRYWARAVGSARNGLIEQAQHDLGQIERLANQMAGQERVWGRNTAEVFRLQAAAWLALARGELDRAEELMRSAVELEDQTDKSSVSPGPSSAGTRTAG